MAGAPIAASGTPPSVSDFLRASRFNARGRGAAVAPESLYFNRAGKGSIAEWHACFGDHCQGTLHEGYLSLPTGNHDSSRIASGRPPRGRGTAVAERSRREDRDARIATATGVWNGNACRAAPARMLRG